MDRAALEARWLRLTRETLPAMAAERGWPVSADHCFQRILLDHAVGGRWYDHIAGRPAYRHIDAVALARAAALGEAVAAGATDLHRLDAQSLSWRGKRPTEPTERRDASAALAPPEPGPQPASIALRRARASSDQIPMLDG